MDAWKQNGNYHDGLYRDYYKDPFLHSQLTEGQFRAWIFRVVDHSRQSSTDLAVFSKVRSHLDPESNVVVSIFFCIPHTQTLHSPYMSVYYPIDPDSSFV